MRETLAFNELSKFNDTLKAYLCSRHSCSRLRLGVFLSISIKGINRLISKRMSNIYLKVTIEKN